MKAQFVKLLLLASALRLFATFDLTILHTNDVHARIGQFNAFGSDCRPQDADAGACFGGEARRLTKVKEIRSQRPNVLLLDGGDRFVGTLWFTQFKGIADSTFMNRFPYDAMCFGNHEFDTGVDGLVSFLNNLTFPVVSANIDVSQEPRLQGLFTKSIVKNVGGEDIGIVGYTTKMAAVISKPGPTVTFMDEIDSIQAEVNNLKLHGVNIIIAVGHAGYGKDQEIARRVNGLDIVVGGHTDTFLYTGTPPSDEEPKGPYPTVVTNPSGSQTLVVQDFTWGKYLGQLNVEFDNSGNVVSYTGNPILLDSSVAEDPDTKALVDTMGAELEAVKNELVGKTLVTLDGERESCRLKECNLGNLITDATIDYHATFAHPNDTWAPAAIAIANGGGIRSSIALGEITMGNVLEVLPFGNEIDLITIRGSTLLKALERSVSNYDPVEKDGAFLQFSGLHVVYDVRKRSGRRVMSVKVRCQKCLVPTYSALDEEQIYRVLLPSFLIDGGDGYSMFTEEKLSQERFNSLDSGIIRAYLQKHSPVHPEVNGRISIRTKVRRLHGKKNRLRRE